MCSTCGDARRHYRRQGILNNGERADFRWSHFHFLQVLWSHIPPSAGNSFSREHPFTPTRLNRTSQQLVESAPTNLTCVVHNVKARPQFWGQKKTHVRAHMCVCDATTLTHRAKTKLQPPQLRRPKQTITHDEDSPGRRVPPRRRRSIALLLLLHLSRPCSTLFATTATATAAAAPAARYRCSGSSARRSRRVRGRRGVFEEQVPGIRGKDGRRLRLLLPRR